MWTEIIDLVILGRDYWSSCRVLSRYFTMSYFCSVNELHIMDLIISPKEDTDHVDRSEWSFNIDGKDETWQYFLGYLSLI